ncbi:MAG: tetratricopeptide repeat protein [Verrucomicrobiota bacterium]
MNESVEEMFDEANGELALGELENAATLYRRCTELEPGFFDGWHALGMALMKLERYEEAIDAGKKAIEIRPNDQIAYTSLSLAYVRNGQIKEAEDMGAKARILSWGGKVVKDDKAN